MQAVDRVSISSSWPPGLPVPPPLLALPPLPASLTCNSRACSREETSSTFLSRRVWAAIIVSSASTSSITSTADGLSPISCDCESDKERWHAEASRSAVLAGDASASAPRSSSSAQGGGGDSLVEELSSRSCNWLSSSANRRSRSPSFSPMASTRAETKSKACCRSEQPLQGWPRSCRKSEQPPQGCPRLSASEPKTSSSKCRSRCSAASSSRCAAASALRRKSARPISSRTLNASSRDSVALSPVK
mmetsp:Transcript_178455/g.571795  ORF Transcript_178455/g.571795 Transcript_178455/m.571795 type:complete len:247 (-) Transcript_178455:869-1609(-)